MHHGYIRFAGGIQVHAIIGHVCEFLRAKPYYLEDVSSPTIGSRLQLLAEPR
jgi:hypothetical protein